MDDSSKEDFDDRPFLKKVRDDWNKMNDNQRSSYYFLQNRDKIRHEQEMEEYIRNRDEIKSQILKEHEKQ